MIVALCIFFFKQKTAYEVRISDWSSDVCSSDLCSSHVSRRRPRPMSRAQSLPPLLGRDAPHGLTCGLRVVERDHTSPDDLSLLMPFAGEEEEIGRGSCRERECQYG